MKVYVVSILCFLDCIDGVLDSCRIKVFQSREKAVEYVNNWCGDGFLFLDWHRGSQKIYDPPSDYDPAGDGVLYKTIKRSGCTFDFYIKEEEVIE